MTKRILTIIIAIIAIGMPPIDASATTRKPHPSKTALIEQPETMAKKAMSEINKAIKSHNASAAIAALEEYETARIAISDENTSEVISMADRIADAFADNAAAQSLLALFKAKIYANAYNINRWNYDRRQLPTEQMADDYTEWSGDQFRMVISDFVEKSIASPAALAATDILTYKPAVTISDETLIYYPTLLDFVVTNGTSILDRCSNESINLLSDKWFDDSNLTELTQTGLLSETDQLILKMLMMRLDYAPEGSASRMMSHLSLYKFINSHLYDSNCEAYTRTLFELYRTNKEEFWSAEALLAADTNCYTAEYYRLLNEYIAVHPNAPQMAEIKNIINRIKQPSVKFSTPSIVALGESAQVDFELRNTDTCKFTLYKITSAIANNVSSVSMQKVTALPVAEIDVQLSEGGEIPYTHHSTTSFTPTEYGVYCLVPSFNGKEEKNYWVNVIRCTDMMTISLSDNSKINALVTNLTNGAPIKDAEVKIKSGGYRKDTSFGSAKTDTLGIADIKSVNYGDLFAVVGDDRFGASTSFYTRSPDNNRLHDAAIFTDLPIYHPGDSVKCAAVVYEYGKSGRHLQSDLAVTFTLYDANYQVVDTRQRVTDEFGRAEADFKLPVEGLTGIYTIGLNSAQNSVSSNITLTVSDYKLPTFEVKADRITNQLSQEGRLTIGGEAKYYSGFALADAEVKVTLRGRRNLWWRADYTPDFYSTTTRTDTDGRFDLTLTDSIVNRCPITGAVIEAAIAVTSPAGETRFTKTSFATGKPFAVAVNAPENINAAQPAHVSITATDAIGKSVALAVNITLTDEYGNRVYNSSVDTPVSTLDMSHVPSGEYTLTVTPQDLSLADATEKTTVILYRPDDLKCPVNSDLWIPVSETKLATGTKTAKILYGTSNPDANIFVITNCRDEAHDIALLKPSAGLHTLNVTIEDDEAPVTVTLLSVHNGNVSKQSVKLYPEPYCRSLALKTESFRDRVTSGATETWTIRAVDSADKAQTTAFMLSMYSKALTTLAPTHNTLSFNRYHWPTTVIQNPANGISGAYSQPYKTLSYTPVTAPSFNNITAYATTRIMGAGAVMYKNATLTSGVEMAMMDMAADKMEESIEEESAAVDSGMSDNKSDDTSQAQYRAVEEPLVFFAPMLTSDKNGLLTYTFTLPDANTTWVFDAIGFTADPVLGASLSKDVIADKPVMVNSNLPRYLRRGDTATLPAMVMNNTDSTATLTATVEIIDPATMQVVLSMHSEYELTSGASKTVAITVTVPDVANALIYRVKATNGTFTDGEQKLLPILEATQPVIESTPFYIAPDKTQFEITVPPKHSDSKVTLQLCENIAWEVVTALPGLMQGETNTSNSAAARLFSAAMAEGIMRDNPDIARAIRLWSSSDRSDSTLVSMLERNSDLKTLMLNATPWVGAAMSDTERMSRLALLLDRRAIADTYTTTIAQLEKLERNGGGWAWMNGYDEVSEWSTYNILSMFAQLKRLGYMPDNDRLNKMTSRALDYLDRSIAAEYSKHPKGDYSQYTFVRSLLSTPAPSTAARRVIDSTIQQILGDRSGKTLTTRALDAIILEKNGYHASAMQILQSLSEYAEKSPEKGMWWPRLATQSTWSANSIAATALMLDAYATVDPGNRDIDLIRQWLIINKTTQDWGSSVATAEVCASILAAGTKWAVPARGITVTIDDREIALASGKSYTGYSSTDITADMTDAPSSLTVQKQGNYPSFGAVIDRFTGVMRRIRANSCDAVSITKRHLVKNGTEWVESDNCRVGDIVKISLTIKAEQALDYVTVTDNRAAGLEPVEQTPRPIYADGLCFYRENRDASTNLFISRLPRGTYILEYEMTANNAGEFASGIATLISQYNPAMTAHSAGTIMSIK